MDIDKYLTCSRVFIMLLIAMYLGFNAVDDRVTFDITFVNANNYYFGFFRRFIIKTIDKYG